MPRQEVGKSFLDLVLIPELVPEERGIESHSVPWNEGEVGICAASVNKFPMRPWWVHSQFVSNDVLPILENAVQDPEHPHDLLNVPAFGCWDVFCLLVEPHCLSIIRPLSRHLKMQVLSQQPSALPVLQGQRVECIICLDEVLDDGARLPKSKIVIVWINYDRRATIGVKLEEGLALDVLDLDFVIRNAKLFQRDQDFERVWAASYESLA